MGNEMEYLTKSAVKLAIELLKKKPLDYDKIMLVPRKRGVYLIYNKQGKIMYVGESNKLRVRLLSDHISGEEKISTSTFRRKLTKEPFNLHSGKEMLNYIKTNCLFCWIEIEDKDLCHLVEALLITYLRKEVELVQEKGLLNS